MTRKQALERYINASERRKKFVNIIMYWNDKLSIRMNAENLHIRNETALQIAKKYKLNYKKIGYGKRSESNRLSCS